MVHILEITLWDQLILWKGFISASTKAEFFSCQENHSLEGLFIVDDVFFNDQSIFEENFVIESSIAQAQNFNGLDDCILEGLVMFLSFLNDELKILVIREIVKWLVSVSNVRSYI